MGRPRLRSRSTADGAKLVLRVDRYAPAAPKPVAAVDDESQLALFTVENGSVSIAEAPKLPELVPVPAPPENRVRRLSYSALALFEMCSYRFYAERLVGLRETKPALGDGKREAGLAATEIGDMAHVILEELDLADPRPPDELAEVVRARYATATDEEVARIGVARRRVLRLRDRAPPGRPSGGDRRALVRVRARRGPPARAARRLPRGRRQGARRRLQDERPRGRLARARSSSANIACSASSTPSPPCAPEPTRSRSSTSSSSVPNELVTASYKADEAPALEEELSRAIAAIQSGEFRPTPSEYACSTCPALNLVCAGPNLRGS